MMALTNAERQKRYRERLKGKARAFSEGRARAAEAELSILVTGVLLDHFDVNLGEAFGVTSMRQNYLMERFERWVVEEMAPELGFQRTASVT